MKTTYFPKHASHRRRQIVACLWLVVAGCFPSLGQLSVDWHTIDGGGGTSTSGVYSVTGTIGQPDAGTMSGGAYSLSGGFWSLLSVVQTPDAPLLSITLTTTNTAVVSWPSPSTGFALQQNNDLNTTNWVGAAESPTDSGVIKFIIVNQPTGNRYYRLFRP